MTELVKQGYLMMTILISSHLTTEAEFYTTSQILVQKFT